MYKKCIKRILDFIFALVLTVFMLPVFAIIAIVIRIDSKGNILFKQKRVGLYKSHFMILKFRTMKTDTPSDCATELLNNPDFFITRTGAILRKTSLDELPQLINILKGDMSFVGPRPALWNQFDLIEERDKYGANDVKPGLTGWAQINGRDELSIKEKSLHDGYYVEKISFWFDFKCIIKTIGSVLKSEGVVEGDTKSTRDIQE